MIKATRYKTVSWNDLTTLIAILGSILPKKAKLYGIPRGGQIVANLLNYAFPETTLITNLQIWPSAIIIEDIVDTGYTIDQKPYRSHRVATLFHRKTSFIKTQWYAQLLTDDHYVIFPWEVNPKQFVPDILYHEHIRLKKGEQDDA